ncbi:MAG: ribonuclease Z [Candidatus Aenigmarchaeota archaeon]|nr:ribonuclease Z [Candidatus Aenigmarchaeota archaeon]
MTKITVTFLGTTASIPTAKRNHPAVHLNYQSYMEHNFLFDCGEGTQRQIFSSNVNFMRIDHIFITHWHADHFAGLFGLLETMGLEKRKEPLHIYAPEADKFLERLLNLGYSSKPYEVIQHNVEFEGNEIQILLNESEFQIVSIPVKHGVPAVAYGFFEKNRLKVDKEQIEKLKLPSQGPFYKKIKEKGSATFKGREYKLEELCFVEKGKHVVYSGDTMPCRNIVKISKDADLLIHDSTYFEDMKRKHSSLDQVIQLVKDADAKQVILTHISRRYQNEKELEDKIKPLKNFRIAKDFMEVVI